MPEKSDTALVIESREGKEEAFSQLVKRHMEKAVQLAHFAAGNYEDARDISQEAFVKAHRSLKHFEMKSKFSTWFYRILMNTAKDFLRRKKWRGFLTWKTGEEMESFFENVPDRRDSPGEGLLTKELGSQISRAVKKLPLKQRWIFTLRFIEGLSIRQISEVADVSEGTVKAALHFAVQKFKKEILPYAGGGEKIHGF